MRRQQAGPGQISLPIHGHWHTLSVWSSWLLCVASARLLHAGAFESARIHGFDFVLVLVHHQHLLKQHLTPTCYSSCALTFLFFQRKKTPLTSSFLQFHQVVRATTPMFTILLNYIFFKKQSAPQVYISLIPVVAGVGLATYGDYYVRCCCAVKRTFTEPLQTTVHFPWIPPHHSRCFPGGGQGYCHKHIAGWKVRSSTPHEDAQSVKADSD